MRCNMYDRYVPISSSAQWERAIGRESNEERSAVCGTYVELRRDHSSRCCWHLARGTWRSRSGEWSTHEEAIERLAGSRARESVCRCAPAAVVVFAAHFTRSFVPAPLAAIDARLPAPTHRPPCRANASRPPYATPGHCGSGLGRRDRVDFSLSTHWAGFSLVRDLFGTFGFDGFWGTHEIVPHARTPLAGRPRCSAILECAQEFSLASCAWLVGSAVVSSLLCRCCTSSHRTCPPLLLSSTTMLKVIALLALVAVALAQSDRCPPGQFSSNGMTPCCPCYPGSYSSVYGSTSCVPCDAGT